MAVVVHLAWSGRSLDARDSAEILINSPQVLVRHILKRGPGHNLEKITIERSVKAVRGSSSGTIRVEMIEVFAGPHDFKKLSERSASFGPAGFVRC